MPTPLYDALRRFAGSDPLRLHMPGHKGKPVPMPELSALSSLDFTELPPTGNLFDGGGPIQEAEDLWAADFGMDSCLFLTGGSTQGIHSALALTCRPGDAVLMDRGMHRSACHAMALLDLRPVYLGRPWLEGAGVCGPIRPEAVERELTVHPEIHTVFVTSPTYYGVLSDLPSLARVCHAHGARLVVDAAHGAHLPFLGESGIAAADVAVVSAHKTLPAPGQSALLFVNGIPPQRLRETAGIFGSSSPSYPMMAALDCVRSFMEKEGGTLYRRSAERTASLRRRTPALTEEDASLDPTRYVLCCRDGEERALQELGIYPEMSDRGHVVCIFTCADTGEDFARLERALDAHGLMNTVRPTISAPPPLHPEQRLTPRQALFAPALIIPQSECEGRIAARPVAPYPPGIPVVAPGEIFDKKLLAYLTEIGYNRPIAVISEGMSPLENEVSGP